MLDMSKITQNHIVIAHNTSPRRDFIHLKQFGFVWTSKASCASSEPTKTLGKECPNCQVLNSHVHFVHPMEFADTDEWTPSSSGLDEGFDIAKTPSSPDGFVFEVPWSFEVQQRNS